MTIYVVTQGAYSDHHIVGVYESRGLAEEVHGQDCEIEEWPLNTDLNEHRDGVARYNVMMLRDGTVHNVSQYWKNRCEPRDCEPMDYFQYNTKITIRIAEFEMWAKDAAHAIKIANERRTQLIAENKW